MLSTDNLFRLSGIVLSLVLSVSVITYTGKYIFGAEKTKKPIIVNQIYDPNHGLNISHICILSKNAYATMFNESPCYNKTLVEWYIPWVRYQIWKDFKSQLERKKQTEEVEILEEIPNETNETGEIEIEATTDPPKEANSAKVQKLREKPSEYIYSILVCLLLISAVAAIWEVLREKLKGESEEAAAKTAERQCTLAEFTINRHLRRESASQQRSALHLPRQGSLERTAKVTQTLIHQSSLDRAFPKIDSEVSSLEPRRNSVPSFLINDKAVSRNVPAVSPAPFGTSKRQSVDVTGEDAILDSRKKPRHFIRRH